MMNAPRRAHSLLALIALAGAGCGGNAVVTSAFTTFDPYYYYSYYPADIYYSSYYWTDPYSAFFFEGLVAQSTVVGSGNISSFRTVGDAVRALALGQQVCPNVTVTPKTAPDPCAPSGGPATVRNGVTIQFNGCALSDGGIVQGTFDVQATRTASDASCSASTIFTIAVNTTVTDLTYIGPGGRKLVIPNENGTSTLTYALGQAPTSSPLNLAGHMQVFAPNGTILLDNAFSGTATVTPQDKTAYALDGSLVLQDQLVSATTTLTPMGLTRTTDCCRPSAGTLTATRTGATNTGTHVWSFGPNCGMATFDGTNVTLPGSCL
jgi:hypothetical protein